MKLLSGDTITARYVCYMHMTCYAAHSRSVLPRECAKGDEWFTTCNCIPLTISILN